jgi:hypothetical protein
MVIPLTHVALILREKNKRKMMMNNIKNTMCRLSDLTREQANNLVAEMPSGQFDFGSLENVIGAARSGNWGTWVGGIAHPTIVTYAEMMQLLKGKDMNKQTAQEQIAVMQIEMDKLKAIIDRPEVKTGRVMSGGDLKYGAQYFYTIGSVNTNTFRNDSIDRGIITVGAAFHDKETAKRHLEYLKLEQELRRALSADGGEGIHTILLRRNNSIGNEIGSVYHEKISFNTREARDSFRAAHTDKQLTLLIRGV